MAVPIVGGLGSVLLSVVAPFLGQVARWLLSGIVAKVIFSVILNGVIFGALFLFYRNFVNSSLDYAIGFFNFFGFGEIVNRIQYNWNQLPVSFTSTVSYFQLGGILGYIVNNYIGSIFLAWIMRRFG